MIGFKLGFFVTCATSVFVLFTQGAPLVLGKATTRFALSCSISLVRCLGFIWVAYLPSTITRPYSFWMPFLGFFVMLTVLLWVIFFPFAGIFTSRILTFYVISMPLLAMFLWVFRTAFLSFLVYLIVVFNSVLAVVFTFTLLTSAIIAAIRCTTFNTLVHVIANKKRLLLWVVSADKQPAKGVDFLFYRLFVSKAIIPYIGGIV